MSEGRAIDVLQRFAHLGQPTGARLALSSVNLRRLIAASTEAHLAVHRMFVVHDAAAGVLEERPVIPPDLSGTTSWAAAVFRANGAALAELDRIVSTGAAATLAIDLIGRPGYWSGRSSLPIEQAADDELDWRIDSLDASLSTAASMGIEPAPSDLGMLEALRAERARRT